MKTKWIKSIIAGVTAVSCLLPVSVLAADSEPPIEPQSEVTHLVNHDEIKDSDYFVDAAWAKEKLDSDEGWRVVEVGYGDESYKKGHIEGAVRFDTMEVENEETDWNLLPVDDLVQPFLDKGLAHDSKVIFYGDDLTAAARIAFAAYLLGIEDIKLLDGGKSAWEAAGYELVTDEPEVTAVEDFGVEYPVNAEEYIKTSDDLIAAKEANPELVIASTRSWSEFIGEVSGYDYIDEAGEIEGAVWAATSTTAYDINYLANEDGTLKDPSYVLEDWANWGITPDKAITFYCGTGWRNTVTFFLAKQLGFENVSVQDGGWYEWNLKHKEDADKYPVQIGDPRS